MNADPGRQHLVGMAEIELPDKLQKFHRRADGTVAGRWRVGRPAPDTHHPIASDVGDYTPVPLHDLEHSVEVLIEQSLYGVRRQPFRKRRETFDVRGQTHRITD